MRAALLVVTGCTFSEASAVGRADIARVLYLNDCRPSGCLVYPGADDARLDRSSIVDRQTYLDPFDHSAAVWDELVACMRHMYEPFELAITTYDPGSAPHVELMVAGHPQSLGLLHGGGAVIATCPHAVRDNALAFVFASSIPPEYL
jgi:hypothetical protein